MKQYTRCVNFLFGVCVVTHANTSASSSTTLHLSRCKHICSNSVLFAAQRNFAWNPFSLISHAGGSNKTQSNFAALATKFRRSMQDLENVSKGRTHGSNKTNNNDTRTEKIDVEAFLADSDASEKIWYDILDTLGDDYLSQNSAAAVLDKVNIMETSNTTDALDKLVYVRTQNVQVPSYVMFDLVYNALLSPHAQELEALIPSLLRLLRVVLKQQLDELLVACHTEIKATDESATNASNETTNADKSKINDANMNNESELKRATDFDQDRFHALLNLFDALADGVNQLPVNFVNPDLLSGYIDKFKKAFPQTAETITFHEFIRRVETIALKAKLCNTLRELCLAFDQNHSGKVVFRDFSSTLSNVLGQEQAEKILRHVKADAEGMINYNQLITSLMQVKPINN